MHPNYKGPGKVTKNPGNDVSVVPSQEKDEDDGGFDDHTFVHVCFDLETTGLSHSRHEIIEIYVETIHGKEKEKGKESFHHFVKPVNGVGDSHLIHGITDDHPSLKNAHGFKKIATDMMKFIEDEVKHFEEVKKVQNLKAALVAYNGNAFDVPFLLKQLELHDVPLSNKVVGQWDPLLVVKNMAFSPIPKDKSLGTIHWKRFGGCPLSRCRCPSHDSID